MSDGTSSTPGRPAPKFSLAPSLWWLMQAGMAVLEGPLVPAPAPQHWQGSAEGLGPSSGAVTAVLLTSLWDHIIVLLISSEIINNY